MPVYKVEKYLKSAIDSVLAQTLADFELILVDDGSTDNCGSICDEYANRDTRIHVLHQKNKGVSAARNVALEIATGEYISFVDADDWIEPVMLECMYKTAKINNADMVICNYREEESNAVLNFQSQEPIKNADNYFGIEAIKKVLLLPSFCCTRIIKQSCIGNTKFQDGVIHAEDLLFLVQILRSIKKVAYLDSQLYIYRIRPDSAVRRPFYDEFLDSIIISEYCAFTLLKEHIALKSVCYFRIFRSLNQAIGKLECESKQTQQKFHQQIVFLQERMSLYSINFLFNPYISYKSKCLLSLFIINPKLYFCIKPILKSCIKILLLRGKV